MIKTNEPESSATIKLPKSIYTKKNIVKCLEIYKEFLSAKLEESERNFRLTIKTKTDDYAPGELASEFANYLIALEKERK